MRLLISVFLSLVPLLDIDLASAHMIDEKSPSYQVVKKQEVAEFSVYRDNFRLIDSRGKAWVLTTTPQDPLVVVMAWQPSCPWAPTLLRYASRGASSEIGHGRLLFLDPERPQDRAVVEKIRAGNTASPILMDYSQAITRGFGFNAVGDYFVLDPKTGKIIITGSAFDGQLKKKFADPAREVPGGFGARIAAKRDELWGKAQRLLARCELSYQPPPKTLSPGVGEALNRTCLNCHQSTPATDIFRTLEDFRAWHSMNRQVMRLYRMPLGGVDYASQALAEAPKASDLSLVANWIENGEPGSAGDDFISDLRNQNEAKKRKEEERGAARHPDLVWSMKAFDHISTTDKFRYDYKQIAGPVDRDLYVRASSIAMNLNVIHHVNVFILPVPLAKYTFRGLFQPNISLMRGLTAMPGYERRDINEDNILATWSFQQGYRAMPEGTVFLIPKGSYVVLQHHYQTSGKPEKNKTVLSLFLAKDMSKLKLLHRARLPRKPFVIPPGAESFEIKKHWKLKTDVELVIVGAHGHYRHARYFVNIIYPDGGIKNLLNVPVYNQRFPPGTSLSRPVFVPKGSDIVFHQIYDNSTWNPSNPDSTAYVKNGFFTDTEEMDFARILYTEGRGTNSIDLRDKVGAH